MHWYHDHRLERTARNVWRGLAGMWISDDALDASLPLPRGRRDIPLMICDRSFDRTTSSPIRSRTGAMRPTTGSSGKPDLVNGAVLPHHRVDAAVTGCGSSTPRKFRHYNLALSGRRPR